MTFFAVWDICRAPAGALQISRVKGSFHLGAKRAGFEVVFANDFDRFCKQTYDANFLSPEMTLGDIADIEESTL